jgi:hypothetical protein
MPRRYISLQDCLFRAFANATSAQPQESRQMWAIHEGLRRIERGYGPWRSVDARKEHKCIRCHLIKNGDVYFQHDIGRGWGSAWKFCAGCMAMILYFMEVDKLPPYLDTHWDLEQERPVRLAEDRR